ncbi:hypothetical protein [Desulfohalovibrio reitneri]|uniref:hypothetical protein n=1 Tax=Desulfohalovibrio reitneri TaxID=1307759 RepID=UPI00068C23E3|nr:hypothetical protein [Desulfohalovibrio reitneri]
MNPFPWHEPILDPGPAETEVERYLADLREVMELPSGAGMRVLWRLREAAGAGERLGGDPATLPGNAALADYVRDREAEMAVASPERFAQMLSLAARLWAADHQAAVCEPQPDGGDQC